jgi:Flp pilus assembly pilin Flp
MAGRDPGQGATEYLIMLALVAIAVIGIVSLFGDQIQELFSGRPAEVTQVDGGAPTGATQSR